MKNRSNVQKNKRDMDIAHFSDKLASFQEGIEFEKNKQELVKQYTKLIDTIFLADDDQDYQNYKKLRSRRKLISSMSMLIIGILVGVIPMFLYVIARTSPVDFQYVPNVIGYKKPTYVQRVKTQKEVQVIEKSHIRDAHLVSIGAVVQLGEIGLSVVPAAEMGLPSYHLKELPPQEDKKLLIEDFVFLPDALMTKDPIPLQILHTETEVEAAKDLSILHNKDLLEVGAAVNCPGGNMCFTIAQSTLEKEYSKVVPISNLLSQERI